MKAIDEFCWNGNWMNHIGDRKGVILDKAVNERRPMKALELGTYLGYSSIRIGRLLPEDGRLISIDKNKSFQDIAQQMLNFAGLRKKVEYWTGNFPKL